MIRLLFLLFIFSIDTSYGQNYFEKFFYGQHGTACAREDSAGHIIVSFPEDSTIIMYDSVMNPVWTKTYNFSTFVFEILDNGNLLCGGYKSDSGISNAFIALLDTNGDTLWTRTPGVSNYNKAVYQMKRDKSGNIFFMIYLAANPAFNFCNQPVEFGKMDMAGNMIASYNYTTSGCDFNFNFTNSRTLVCAITTSGFTMGDMCSVDFFDTSLTHLSNVTLLDTTGNPHEYRAGIVFPDSTKTIVGGSWDWYTAFFDVNNIYNMSITQPLARFREVIRLSNGGFLWIGEILQGVTEAFAQCSGCLFTSMILFPGIQGVDARFVQETKDGFLISGTALDSNSQNIPWMTKMDKYGLTPTSTKELIRDKSLQIEFLNNTLQIKQIGADNLVIIDISGRIVKTYSSITNQFSIDILEDPGIYILTFYKGRELINTKKIFIPIR